MEPKPSEFVVTKRLLESKIKQLNQTQELLQRVTCPIEILKLKRIQQRLILEKATLRKKVAQFLLPKLPLMAFSPNKILDEHLEVVKQMFKTNTKSKTILAAFKYLTENLPKIQHDNFLLDEENKRLKKELNQLKENYKHRKMLNLQIKKILE